MRTSNFQSLELQIRRRVSGLLHGDHDGFRLGPGSEAEEITRYHPGDDVRRIDWNVTARSQEPYVWRTRAEHELESWVLVDETPSMAFGSAKTEKVDLARLVAAAFGLLTDAPGNRVGIARVTVDGVAYSRPRASRKAAHHTMDTSVTASRDGVAALDLASALGELNRRARRPGLRIIVSDMMAPDGRVERPFVWEPNLRRMAACHQVIVVEVIDPRDLTLPDVGSVVFVDPESGRRREIWTSDRKTRELYKQQAIAFRADVAAAVKAAGSGHLVLHTDRDWLLDLSRFVHEWNRS
nr:DUF58 domain-containing protein [Rhodococcus sp. 15-1154-1]